MAELAEQKVHFGHGPRTERVMFVVIEFVVITNG